MNKIEFKNLENKEQMIIAFNQLKDDYSNSFRENERLQERINKAIEFIADYKDQWIGNDDIVDDMNELLSTIKGERQ